MKTLLSMLIASALSCSAAANAGQLVDVNVVDRDTGATLPLHASGGKYYVAGTPGHRYAVRMVNRTGARILTVLSVDGVNAVSGETASANQSGYVLDAYESTEIAGWRKSTEEIAQFNFTALSNSYAARTGRANNVGVIGVAVFRERIVRPIVHQEKIAARDDARERDATPPPVPATAAPSMQGGLAGPTGAAAQAEASSEAPRDSLDQSNAMAKSLANAVIFDNFVPGEGANSYMVTTGPG